MEKTIPIFEYWSNCAGDLFNANDKEISENELPRELKTAWDKLWSEDYGSYCYLVKNGNEYGILLINEYTTEDNMTHEDVVARARETDKFAKEMGIGMKIYAGLEADISSYDDMKDELIVFMPYDTKPEDVNAVAKFLYKTAYDKDISFENYKDGMKEPESYSFTYKVSGYLNISVKAESLQEAERLADMKFSETYFGELEDIEGEMLSESLEGERDER